MSQIAALADEDTRRAMKALSADVQASLALNRALLQALAAMSPALNAAADRAGLVDGATQLTLLRNGLLFGNQSMGTIGNLHRSDAHDFFNFHQQFMATDDTGACYYAMPGTQLYPECTRALRYTADCCDLCREYLGL